MAPTFPFTGLDTLEIFAVEDTVAQIVWRNLPDGELGCIVAGRPERLGPSGVRGAADITGLQTDADNRIHITLDGRVIAERTVRTTPALDGPALARIATISDLHLGETGFGFLKEMRETHAPAEDYPLRCALAAVREATEWGAELLVIKGDITEHGQPQHWEIFDRLLAEITIPVIAFPGNHDTFAKPGSLDATTELQRRGLFPAAVQTQDLPGARIVAADTTTPRHTWGRIAHRADELAAAVDVTSPTLLFFHHHLETHVYPRIWPLGTPQQQAKRVLNQLVDTNPDLLISSGHTHRNRARRHGSAVITEVGATKDHPGVWAGYVIHTAGIRQVVRRVAEPSCLEWNDRTHAVVGGIWGRWSPGRIGDRSFTHTWSRQPVSTDTAEKLAAQRSETSSASW